MGFAVCRLGMLSSGVLGRVIGRKGDEEGMR